MLLVRAVGSLWPGIVWTPLSPARVDNLATPDLPGPRWVRVRNLQCGICASDLSLLFVHVDPSVAPAALPGNRRFYLGHEVVSVVEAVGSGVTRVRPGDRVVMDTRFTGPHCLSQEIDPPCRHCAQGQHVLCENASAGLGPRGVGGGWGDGYTAHETEVYPVPADLTLDQATLIEPLAVAVHAVLRRPPEASAQVLVMGCGMIGLLTIQTIRAVAPGCGITAVARYPHQAEAARRLGATTVLNGASYASAAQITGAKHFSAPLNKGMLLGGFDVVYDCVGKAGTLGDSLRLARAGGAVVIVGIELAPQRLDHSPIWYQEVDLVGSMVHGVDEWRGRRQHTYAWVIEWLRTGALSVDGLITHRFGFEQHRAAIDASLDKAGERPLKVIFTFDPGVS
jgi:threonine dehydrogenase-like Zn-dependent dehydrogenase